MSSNFNSSKFLEYLEQEKRDQEQKTSSSKDTSGTRALDGVVEDDVVEENKNKGLKNSQGLKLNIHTKQNNSVPQEVEKEVENSVDNNLESSPSPSPSPTRGSSVVSKQDIDVEMGTIYTEEQINELFNLSGTDANLKAQWMDIFNKAQTSKKSNHYQKAFKKGKFYITADGSVFLMGNFDIHSVPPREMLKRDWLAEGR